MLKTTPESYSTYKLLKTHREFLIGSTDYLKNSNHTIAFIGKVGVGKTTAISKLLNLIDCSGKELLQTGSGRTTVCEVEIRESNRISIEVEPYSNDEVEKYLEEFSTYIENKILKKTSQSEKSFTLSSEIERALRNMLELKIRRFKENGKRKSIDDAVELYNSCSSKDEFYQKLLQRINLSNRTTTEIFTFSDSKEWIRNNFEEINNGKNKNVPLPKKIIININENPVKIPKINLSFLDTKGVDETANRQDIENQLKDSRTISVLCTSFNDAPDKVSTDILRYMKDSGLTKYISKRIIILVLDKNGEAECIADLEEPDLEEGREIRKDQIERDLKNSLNLDDIEIVFFNSKEDDPEELISILINKVLALRKEHENQVETIIESLDEIEKQTNTQLSSEALRRVRESVSIWIKDAENIQCNLKKNFTNILEIILDKGTHASSVRACVNRRGQWHNLDYYKILSDASRYQTVKAFDKSKNELNCIISNMLKQKDLHYQKGTLNSIQNILEKRVEKIYQEAYDRGRDNYFDNLFNDDDLWSNMMQEWGKGTGYKNRISSHTEQWFLNQDHDTFDKENSEKLNLMWQELLVEINNLIGNEN
ncbi:hypothetical protein [Methanothermococcus thermolithotrophicus]|nr:hypothetical protein [Methanothermococcus thermolithotrophicus]